MFICNFVEKSPAFSFLLSHTHIPSLLSQSKSYFVFCWGNNFPPKPLKNILHLHCHKTNWVGGQGVGLKLKVVFFEKISWVEFSISFTIDVNRWPISSLTNIINVHHTLNIYTHYSSIARWERGYSHSKVSLSTDLYFHVFRWFMCT